MNPRVSRSSALASKATGFPIAKIAAKLAIGYRLDEIPNDITKVTPASFEPTLDYVVVKVPRFNFEKFPAADTTLTTTMKSVGEAMAIGRNYTRPCRRRCVRSRSADRASTGATSRARGGAARDRKDADRRSHRRPAAGAAPRCHAEQAFDATAIDPWFIDQIVLINEVAEFIGGAESLDADTLRVAKEHGFSDAQIAQIRGLDEAEVRESRYALEVRPVYKTVDTCAGSSRPSRRTTTPRTTPRPRSPLRPHEGRHHRFGPQPHRSGRRVRLLVRARLVRALGRRIRDRHGQLQPRDRVDRLRHLRPPVLRAADARRRARGAARRGPVGDDPRRRLPARRPDAPGPGQGHRGGGLHDPRHQPRGDRPRGGA